MPPIILKKQPRLDITELRLEYFSASAISELTSSTDGMLSYKYASGLPIIESNSNIFTSDFIGGNVVIDNPQNIKPSTASAIIAMGSSVKYESTIINVINSRLAVVSPPYIFKVQSDSNGYQSSIKYNFIPSEFSDSIFTASYRKLVTSQTGSYNFQSYANIEIADLFPTNGKISTVKTLIRTSGFRTFDYISEHIIEDTQLFTDLTSSTNEYINVGNMISDNNINYYWVSESVGGSSTQYVNSYDNSILNNAWKIGFNTPTTNDRSNFNLKISSIKPVKIFKDNEYILSFKVSAHGSNDWDNSIIKLPKLSVHISGSAIRNSNNIYGRMIDQIISNTPETASIRGNGLLFTNQFGYNYGDGENTIPRSLQDSGSGVVNNITNKPISKNIFAYKFKADSDGYINPVFSINTGVWYISEVSIKPQYNNTGTPSHIKTLIKIPPYQQNDRIDIKLEFYNDKKEISNISVLTSSLFFTGSNFYINGTDNWMAGNMYLGNLISFINGAAAGTDNIIFQVSDGISAYSQSGAGNIESTAPSNFSDLTLGGIAVTT